MEPKPPPAAPTQAPTNRQKVPEPQSPSLTGQGPRNKPPQPRPAPTEATVSLLDLTHPAVTYSMDATTALQELPMAPGPGWVPHLLAFQEQDLQRDDPPEATPIYTPDRESVQMLLAQGDPPIRPNRHPHPPPPPPQRPREARCL